MTPKGLLVLMPQPPSWMSRLLACPCRYVVRWLQQMPLSHGLEQGWEDTQKAAASQKGLGWEAKLVLEYCICSIMSPCMHCKAGIVGSNVLSSLLCRMWVESWWCVSLCWCVLLCVLIRSVC
jgi:hypothetical protein